MHEAVKAAVRAWASAGSSSAGAAALSSARRRLDRALIPTLVAELAEISAELMVEMLAKPEGVGAGAAPVEVEGVALHPKQAERLGAWLEDQRATAGALGLPPKAWLAALERGFSAYGAREGGSKAGPADSSGPRSDLRPCAAPEATALLGAARRQFENPPAPGAGLHGLIAARHFASEARKEAKPTAPPARAPKDKKPRG